MPTPASHHTVLPPSRRRRPPAADTATPAKLPAEEAALYECVRLTVCDVAAYVADGEFDWQAQGTVRGAWRHVALCNRGAGASGA